MTTKRSPWKDAGTIAVLLILSCAIFMIAEAGYPSNPEYSAGEVTAAVQ